MRDLINRITSDFSLLDRKAAQGVRGFARNAEILFRTWAQRLRGLPSTSNSTVLAELGASLPYSEETRDITR